MRNIRFIPVLPSLLLMNSAAFAATLLEENFESAKSGGAPAKAFQIENANRKARHRVEVTGEHTSPFADGKQALVIDDPDDTLIAKGPGVTVNFAPSTGPLTVRFDYLVPEGQGANGPALLMNSGKASAMRVNLWGKTGRLENRYGSGGFALVPGAWHRVELALSAIKPGPGGETFDISVTPWNNGKAGQTQSAKGWTFNKAVELERYQSLSFAPVAVSKGQPDSKGRIYLDNLLVTGELAPGIPAATAKEAPPEAQPVVAVNEPPVLIDTDFANANKPVNLVSEDGSKSITGVLPEGWADDSSFQNGIKIEYGPVEIDGVKGLRAEKKSSGTQIQIRHELPSFAGGSIYRLELTGRNPQQMGLKFGIRDRGGPYKWHWVTSPNWGDEWQTRAVDFQLPRSGKPVSFLIIATGDGALDLKRVKLTRRSREDILADIKARYPEGGPKNLVRISRFPLGLQSGWAVDREYSLGETVKVETDRNEIGPSGFPALKLSLGGKALNVYSAPFDVAQVLEKHVASVYVKGYGDGTLSVLRDGGGIASTKFRARPASKKELDANKNAGWQRITVPFDPGLGGKFWALRFEANGGFWVDALQVEPGETATPYAPQKVLEVALAPGAGDASLVRIHFDDEPALVRYAVTGKASDAVLRARVVDASGKEAALPPVKLGESALSEGELKYDVLPNTPYGAMRLEAWVEDAGGKPISPVNELVMTRLRRPRYWGKDAPASPFGGHILPTSQNILLAKAAGSNWTRLHDAGSTLMRWYTLESEKGKWNFGDEGIGRYRKANLKILGVLQTTPRWAAVATSPAKAGTYYAGYFLPKDLNDWKNYVRTVTQRYKGTIDTYDVWNEPWGGGYLNIRFDPSKGGKSQFVKPDSPTQIVEYMKLQRAAYETIKEVDPGLKVLVDASNGSWWPRQAELGGSQVSDVYAFHDYPGALLGYPGDPVADKIRGKWEFLQKSGAPPRRSLWMTEGSPVPDKLFSGIYRHTLPYKNEENAVDTANRVARYMLTLLGGNVERMFLYSYGNYRYFGNETQRWAVNVMEDGYPHPSAAAHSTFCWLIEDTRYVKTLQLAEGVYAYVFEGDGRSVAVLTTAPKFAAYAPPQATGVQMLDLFGNPRAAGTLDEKLVYLTTQGPAANLEKLLGGK